jgi:hypothetical protein
VNDYFSSLTEWGRVQLAESKARMGFPHSVSEAAMNHLAPVLDPTDIGSGTPLMVHIEAHPAGSLIGLCGKNLLGIDCDGEAVDCVVCADLARQWSLDY